ncbi:MAG: hypothetical protein U0790_28865 [Isosphaeraceae bacterium]
MALYYRTEYRIGRRTGQVCRTYNGLAAFLAIALDLIFVFTFDFLFSVLFLVLRLTVRLLWFVAYALSLPFRAARWMASRLEAVATRRGGGPAMAKPAWAGFDEV